MIDKAQALSCLSALALVFGTAPAPGAAPERNRVRRVETGLLSAVVLKGHPAPMRLADRMAYYNVPGVSIVVINNGEIEWAKGYGIVEAGGRTPVTPRTRFQAASISKPVTAMAALALVQQGALSLDEDVNRQLKSWHVPDGQFTSREKVTLRRLLNHSAGMTGADVGSYAAGQALPTLVQALNGEKPANTAPIRVDVPPGSTWRYSGGGYSVVQLLMTEVTGKPFAGLLQELVLNKIGMTDSTFEQPLPEEWKAISATGHDVNGHPIEGRWRTFPEAAAAGLRTTASDLARFTIEVQRSFHGTSNKVVSVDTARQMLTGQLGNYGLGIGLGGTGKGRNFSHAGWNEGFTCILFGYFDTGQGAIVMTNGDAGDNLFNEILRSISREYGWSDYQPIEKAVTRVDPAGFRSYVGRYDASGLRTIISSAKGHLYLVAQPLGPRPLKLYPSGGDRFFMLERDIEVSFIKDARGNVTGLEARSPGQIMTATKVN